MTKIIRISGKRKRLRLWLMILQDWLWVNSWWLWLMIMTLWLMIMTMIMTLGHIKGHRFRSPKRPVFVGPLVNHNLKHFARTKQSTSRLNCCSTRLIPGLSYVGCKSDCPLQRHIYSGMDHSHSFRARVPLSLNIFNRTGPGLSYPMFHHFSQMLMLSHCAYFSSPDLQASSRPKESRWIWVTFRH